MLAGENASEARWATEEAFAALAHLALGDHEMAVQTLQRAEERHDAHLRPVLHLLPFTELEQYPAFRALRQRYLKPVDTFSAD